MLKLYESRDKPCVLQARRQIQDDNTQRTDTQRPYRIGSSSKMSATQESQKKTFGKSTREIPHHSQKASKWYPAEDEAQHKKVRYNHNPDSRSRRGMLRSLNLGIEGCDVCGRCAIRAIRVTGPKYQSQQAASHLGIYKRRSAAGCKRK